jgi:hypothetical protein
VDWNLNDLGFLEDINWDEKSLSSQNHDTGSTSSEFLDHIMNSGPSLEGLEFTSDNEEDLDEHLQPGKDFVSPTRKRTIHDVEESPVLPLQDGNSFSISNIQIITVIRPILTISTMNLLEKSNILNVFIRRRPSRPFLEVK